MPQVSRQYSYQLNHILDCTVANAHNISVTGQVHTTAESSVAPQDNKRPRLEHPKDISSAMDPKVASSDVGEQPIQA